MPNVVVEHGPPGQMGVTQIMGLGEDEYMEPADTRIKIASRRVGGFSLALWLAGSLLKNDTVSNLGIGGVLAAVAINRLAK